jgi:two-component system phosphate regulon sensor histidine kinase PhoR
LTALVILAAVVVVVLGVAAQRHLAGILRLREALRRVARNDLNMPLLLDLPRGLRAAERDLQSIAERIKVLGRSAEQERLGLRVVLGSIDGGIFIVDRHMHVRLANDGAARLFEVQGTAEGRTVMEAFRNIELHKLIREGLQEGQPCHGEITLETEGARRILDASVSPLKIGGGHDGAVVFLHDISRIRSLEGVRREFVANVSHELRTPLTIISGYLETLLEGGLEDAAATENALRVMFRHAERLQHLVDDLLTISQVESRTVPLDIQRVDLRELAERVIDQLSQPIRAQGATVRVAASEAAPCCDGDLSRLEQVFLNLLENALKHGNRPGLTVDFRIEAGGPDVRVEVTDNGPGIPFEDQEHVFERFYRVHKHRSRASGGTGLGLSIVKNVVAAHGGSVAVRSTPGQGSTFLVTLPVRHALPAASPSA